MTWPVSHSLDEDKVYRLSESIEKVTEDSEFVYILSALFRGSKMKLPNLQDVKYNLNALLPT